MWGHVCQMKPVPDTSTDPNLECKSALPNKSTLQLNAKIHFTIMIYVIICKIHLKYINGHIYIILIYLVPD